MKVLVALLLLSLALNVFLWRRLATAHHGSTSAEADTTQGNEQRREIQADQATPTDSANADARELARLRNEVGQLRNRVKEADTVHSRDSAQWRAQLVAATQNLARAELQLAEAMSITPEQMQQLKAEAQSAQCVSSLKQIGLAARLWAKDHGDVFPPDFLSMKDQLVTPNLLFCAGDTAAARVSAWSQVDPTSISYRLLNPNGNLSEPTKPLAMCAVHNHAVLGDGSVHRQ